ncbi:MAG TPA: glycosyltransferase family 2 protein [Frankiaceae bacterium]
MGQPARDRIAADVSSAPGSAGRRRSIMVVAYHAADDLRTCLLALRPEERVVVVDNSADPAVRAVAEKAGAQYLDSGGNLGFAGGVNKGLARLGGPAELEGDVLLLNPDAITSSEVLDALQAEFARPGNERLAAVAPVQREPGGRDLQQVGWPFPTPRREWLKALGLGRRLQPDDFLVGSVLLLRREALAELGGLDERYFLYSEETDWQRRAVLRGWRLALVDSVVAEHAGGGTSDDLTRRETLQQAAQETYIRRWYGPLGWQAFRSAVVLGFGARGLLRRGERGSQARFLARLYLAGPRSRAELGAERQSHPSVAHIVTGRTPTPAQREIAAIAEQQAGEGHDVTLIGAPAVASVAPTVRWLPGAGAVGAARSLLRCGAVDSVAVYDRRGRLAARAVRRLVGAPVVVGR